MNFLFQITKFESSKGPQITSSNCLQSLDGNTEILRGGDRFPRDTQLSVAELVFKIHFMYMRTSAHFPLPQCIFFGEKWTSSSPESNITFNCQFFSCKNILAIASVLPSQSLP